MNYKADIAIIGGGASGLVAAITAKRKNPRLSVYILEALDRVGKKLITTGNGRCNITNRNITIDRYHGENSSFSEYALGKIDQGYTENFFSSIGVPFVSEGDKIYPASLQAASVVDCLRFECQRLAIEIICNCKINEIKFKKPFILFSDNDTISADVVICCGGMLSGGEKVGSDGSLFRILKNYGFKGVKASPSIVQLKTETEFVKQLKGIKVDAVATLFKNNRAVKSEFGEVLFCDYGLSGPAILNISREAHRTEGEYFVALDLFPSLTEETLYEMLCDRVKLLEYRKLEEFFTGMLNKRLGQVVLKYCGYTLHTEVKELATKDCKRIANALKSFTVKVLSNTGFNNSQVTAGGISTDEFDPKTMVSRRISGLYACGELLDIDGDCGGFNLQWAWSSGILAGESAVSFLGDKK
ncbi:MAG: aminoacetone oxidase family FAD-binding enzyme [Clostridia bacterium]|nr:aminoacetone oxidase family FAD-binding enzyme [Clostridia bacterium]